MNYQRYLNLMINFLIISDYCYYPLILNFQVLRLLNHFLLRKCWWFGMSLTIKFNVLQADSLILLINRVIITNWSLNRNILLHQIGFLIHHDHKEISHLWNRRDHLLYHFVHVRYLMTNHFQCHIGFICNLSVHYFIIHFVFDHAIILHQYWFHCFPNMFFWQFKLIFAFVKTLNYN